MANATTINKKIKTTRRLMAGCVTLLLVASVSFAGWQFFRPASKVYADNTGARTATSSSNCVNDASIGTAAWTSPGNAAAVDGSSATYSTLSSTAVLTQYINCTNFGFTSAMIPTGSTITGIVATVGKSKAAFGTTIDNSIKLVKGGVIGGNDNKSFAAWSTSITATNYGSSSDLWGQTWAISDITASNFGVAFSASVTGQSGFFSGQANVDYIQLTVYFTAPPVTLTQAGYRIFANADSTDVGSPLAALNTPVSLTSTGQAFRVRNLINVATNPLLTTKSFKLQYVDQGTGSCTSPSGGKPSVWTDVGISQTGASWTLATSSPTWSANTSTPLANLNGTLFVYSGGSVSTSTDGINWTQRNSMPGGSRLSTTLVTFNNKVFGLGGGGNSGSYYHDVYSTTDAITWTTVTSSAPWAARANLTAFVYANKLWVMGGEDASNVYHDVWYSSDGANWAQATSAAAWSARTLAAGTVMNGAMWLMGGWDNSTNIYNDVWTSKDGANWSQVTSSAGWSTRYGHGVVAANNQLVVFGGDHTAASTGALNDVWVSSDGYNWTQTTSSASWAARYEFGYTIFNNQIWIAGGGLSANGSNTNDIWYSGIASTYIGFNDNPTPANGSALTTDANDPTDGGNTVVAENYQENNPAATATQVNAGQDGMWDFSLVDASAPGGTTYCFRMVYSDGTLLDTYSYYPQITTHAPPTTEPLKIKGGVKLKGGVNFVR